MEPGNEATQNERGGPVGSLPFSYLSVVSQHCPVRSVAGEFFFWNHFVLSHFLESF